MSLRSIWTAATLIGAAMVMAQAAQAQTYNLAGDFSNSLNPNGAWSYGSGLSHYPQPSTANTLNSAAANGYWGATADFFAPPFILQTTADGSTTGAYTDNDFVAGDVLVHAPNDGSFVTISWTASSAGSIDFSSSIWYAHSIVNRSQEVSAYLGSSLLGSMTVTNGIGRSDALALSGSNLSVTAGDSLMFRFSKSAGQQFGSLTGINMIVDFTASPTGVPESGSWAMMIVGFGAAGGVLRRRTRPAAALA
jgi:hypothetical protein